MKLRNFVVAVLVSTCGVVSAQDTVDKKDVLGRWIKAIWQDHDRSYIKDNATADFPVETYEAWFDSITTTYPDARVDILHMLAEGDEVALQWEFTGTSSLKGTEGRSIKLPGLSIVKIENGKIASDVFAYNDLDGHRQLGFTLRAPEEDKVRQVILDLHAGLKNKTHDNAKIYDETMLWVLKKLETGEWSFGYNDAIHTNPARDREGIDYESEVEFIHTKVEGDNAIVQVRETGHSRNVETGEEGSWTDVPNIWLLHKNTAGNWKIVGALLGVGPTVETTRFGDGS
jgi:predicted ester cyclase